MLKKQNGYMMLITILSIVLISILGLGLLKVSSNSLTTSTTERSNHSNYYYSEAGINYIEAHVIAEIEELYRQKKNEVNPSLTNADSTFNTNFNTGLIGILNKYNNKELTKNDFKTTANGEPKVKITINYNASNPREFKIQSVSSLSGLTAEKKVERNYSIPLDLINKLTYEEVVVPSVSAPEISSTTFSDPAKIYVSNYLSIQRNKEKLNAEFYTSFKESSILKYAFLWGRGSELKKITTFGASWSTPNTTIAYTTASYTSPSNIGQILNSTTATIDKDYKMPSISNGSKTSYELTLKENKSYTLAFTGSTLKYNQASYKFLVKGTGTLNIVMDVPFHLAVGHRFIIDSASTAKVNLIFRNSVQFNGEVLAKDIYVENGINFEPSYSSKIIADNIYIANGRFDKDFNASVQIDNLYIKKGNLSVTGNDRSTSFGKPLNAKNIYLENGDAHIYAWGTVVTDTITSKSGNVHVSAASCLQAEKIVSNPDIVLNNIGGYLNTKEYYTTRAIVIAGAQINNKPCTKEPVSIPNELPGVVTTVQKTRYDFNHQDIISKGNLVEIK